MSPLTGHTAQITGSPRGTGLAVSSIFVGRCTKMVSADATADRGHDGVDIGLRSA
jgi:NAD(P)-dependent dehydrogenase (short-subunit alcohol dehydrogenase family)